MPRKFSDYQMADFVVDVNISLLVLYNPFHCALWRNPLHFKILGD